MAYPRACPACSMEYAGWQPGASAPQHVTLSRGEGGTPSPWRQDAAGRVLRLHCLGCGSVFVWDYFGPGEGSTLGRLVRIERRGTRVA
jgi:hypothetical protein